MDWQNGYRRLRDRVFHPYALAATLWGLALCLFLVRGPYRLFLYLTTFLVVIHLLDSRYRNTLLTRPLLLLVLAALYPVLVTLAMPEDMVYRRYFTSVYNFLWLVMGIHFLSLHLRESGVGRFAEWIMLLLAIVLLVHLSAALLNLTECGPRVLGSECGVARNPHLLGLFAAMALPLLVHLAWWAPRHLRVPLLVLIGIDLYLLLDSGSRSAWLAVIGATLLTAITLLRSRHRWWVVPGLALLGWLAYLSGIGSFDQRINDLVNNFGSEERLIIWPDAWNMLRANDLAGWLFGHGIGSFRYYFGEFSRYQGTADWVFPHNFLLGVLFETGVTGALLIFGTFAVYLRGLARAVGSVGNAHMRSLCAALFAMSVAQFAHTFLTLPFYSRFTLLSLALVVGSALAVQAHWMGARSTVDA